ncbi:MAG: DnaJ domain-containing protein [Sandaracinaceae bacterium]|nr:DnaJ domain-containing protein [Sandaracinaceae bacterium]
MIAKGARVPRLVEGVDLTSLPLGPLEGFVLSRLDGEASVAVLADLTNLDEGQVHEIVERLIGLGAAEWARESVSLPLPTGRPATRTPSREITVPPFLRGPPSPSSSGAPARVRMRHEPAERAARASIKLDGVYSSRPPAAEEVDMARSSVFPSSSRVTGAPSAPPSSRPPPSVPPALDDIPLPPPPSRDRLARLSSQAPELFGEVPSLDPQAAASATPSPASSPPAAAAPAPPSESPPAPPGEAAPSPLAPSEAIADAARGDGSPSGDAPAAGAEGAPPSSEPAAASSTDAPPPVPEGEALDLDAERRRRIDDLYFALELLDHYEVLGVPREAPRAVVRDAYFQLSKVFHPDTMFRKRLGPYKARMEAIFQRLTEAYETLGKKKGREEYDRYLGVLDKTREVERALDERPDEDERGRLGRQAAQIEADVAMGRPPSTPGTELPEGLGAGDAPARPRTSAPPVAPASSTPPARREMSEEGKRRQRELMAKKLRGAGASSASARRPSPVAPPPTAPKADRQEVLRGLTSTLRQARAQTGGTDPIQRHLAQAKRAEAEGDVAEAANHLRAALLMAPERADVEAEHQRVAGLVAASMAASYEQQARYEEGHGKWAAAAISWGKVVAGRPDDPSAMRHAAEALVAARGDLHRAAALAQRAVELSSGDAGRHAKSLLTQAKVFVAAGLGRNARRVLQRALELDPGNEIAENLLRDLDR